LQEVEADKQNAAKLNALVQITSPTEDWPIGRRSSPDNNGRNRFRYSEQNRSQQSNSGPDSSAKCDTFGEVRKMMSGCLQHCPLVQSIYRSLAETIPLSWKLTDPIVFSKKLLETKAVLLVLFRKVYRSGNTLTRDL